MKFNLKGGLCSLLFFFIALFAIIGFFTTIRDLSQNPKENLPALILDIIIFFIIGAFKKDKNE